LTDILTCKCNLCWHRDSLLGKGPLRYLFGVVLNIKIRQAAKDVGASEEALVDLFERIESFFKRLESYTEVPPTNAMTDIIVKIMVEVLNIFAIATKEIKQGRASEKELGIRKRILTYVQRNSSRSLRGGRTSKTR
jgi:hypothetical protein